jgi:REP element-mobilizing transposase RayT
MRPKQLSFATVTSSTAKGRAFTPRTKHGGGLNQGQRKLARPIDTRKPLHVVFRSERARGEWSLNRLRHAEKIEKLVKSLGRRHHVQIMQYANAGNHLHMVVRAKDRDEFKRFSKTLTGLVARLVTGAKKGNPMGKFWDSLFFSRVIEWGRAVVNAKDYVLQNMLETEGWMDYRPRGRAGVVRRSPRLKV